MSTNLRSYLVRLATEPDRFSEFVANPLAAAENAGLSTEDREVLFSGNQNEIYAALVGGRQMLPK